MRAHKLVSATMLLGIATMSSCIDNDYDLSDIDSTVRVDVNDLVLPVNLDDITLKSIFNIKEGDRVQIVDGQYAFIEDGSFTSDEIKINEVKIASPYIAPVVQTISTGVAPGMGAIPGAKVELDIPQSKSDFSTSSNLVSEFIVSIDDVKVDCDVTISLAIKELAGRVKSFDVASICLQLPIGIDAVPETGTFDKKTGILTATNFKSVGNTASIKLKVTDIDFNKADVHFDAAKRLVTFTSSYAVKSGRFVISTDDVTGSLPTSLTLETRYTMSDIDVRAFTGEVRYDVEGTDISDVSLTDLPDILSQEGTDISIVNPQIYLDVTNPLSTYGVKARTGLAITAYAKDNTSKKYSLNDPYFVIPGAASSQFYLSPETVGSFYPGYSNPVHVPFTSLSDVLSGNGLPERLGIDLVDPCMPTQPVTDFRLGVNLGKVEGKYTFYAPLALGSGSQIIYTETEDGWSSEDLDHVTIETLVVTAAASSDLPLGVDVSAYPIDVNGNRIGNVTVEGASVAAMADGQPIEIRITGEIKMLDGICYTATVRAGDSEQTLKPDMNIKFSNIRAKAKGYYQKEL